MNNIKEEADFAFIYDINSSSLISEIYKYHNFTTFDGKITNNPPEFINSKPIIKYPTEIGIYIHQIHQITAYNYYQKECVITFFINDGKHIEFHHLFKNYLDRVYLSSLNNKKYNWLLASIKIYLDNNTNRGFANYKEGIYLHFIQPNGKKIRIDIKKYFSIESYYNNLLNTIWLQSIINISLKLLENVSHYSDYEDFLRENNEEDISLLLKQ